jgi:N-acetylneuraminate synthase/N,N'-diacetyllegionaminate synthase
MLKNYFNKHINIEQKIIGEGKPVYIIAEAGSNHNGELEQAKKLVDIASEAKADAIKFQLFKSELLLRKKEEIKELKKYEFKKEWLRPIFNYCKKKKITLLASAFDKDNIDLIYEIGIKAIKIASSETLKHDLLFYASKKNLPLIISTGMNNFANIAESLEIVKNSGNKNVSLLQCTSIYPCKPEYVNLNVISTFNNLYDFPIGFSDHSIDITASIAAVAKGSKIIEKHFTSSKLLKGPDHFYSLEPKELKNMIYQIRNCEKMLGSKIKEVEKDEYLKCRINGLYAKNNIKKNSKIKENDIYISFPRIGISDRYKKLATKLKTKKKIKKNSPILWEDLKI